MTEAVIKLPPKIKKIFEAPRGSVRFRGAFGGRGSGKSFNFAKMALIWGVVEPLRFLCTRELQGSIKESFHAELKSAINSEPWLAKAYDAGVDYLRSRINTTEFLFKGLRHNIEAVKSTAQIDVCIVEEAETIPEESWKDLIPTIRAPGSEIWIIWNPKREDSATNRRFLQNTPPRSIIVEMNYVDNPWFPAELEEARAHDLATLEYETYAHIWLGKYLKISKASIFGHKYRVADFEPGADWDGPYFGLDFGFSQDPTAAVKCWVHDSKLYIEYEAGGIGVEIDDTPSLLIGALPGIQKHACRADNARPESISYLKRNGLPLVAPCSKGKGSIEDGIAHIKSYSEIVIHSRCTETADEFLRYSYKVDRISGDILPEPVDKFNHYCDALRYALEPIMKRRRGFFG